MSADLETVTADQPTTFPRTRAEALAAWEEFRPRVALYAGQRNGVRPGHRAVSRLSPVIRQRLVTEYELIESTLSVYPFARVAKFVQEMLWRRYWKSWLELRPNVWNDYRDAVIQLREGLRGYRARRVAEIEEGRSGVAIMDYFTKELKETGYLHNHARMWFAGFWIHTEKLPWELGADFFYRHLLDADPASNTLSWRWVAGVQTWGRPYLTRLSNLRRFLDPELLREHAGGLERLDDQLAEPARVEAPPFARAVPPDDAGDLALPEDLQTARVGLWVHGDDLCVETAAPFAKLRPQGVFAGLGAGLLRDFRVSQPRRDYLRATVWDGVNRAGAHFGVEAVYEEPESLPDAVAAWAKSRELAAVVALRPPVGPLWEVVPAVRKALEAEDIALHLVWRPEDAATLPFAKTGYFNFWRESARKLFGVADADIDVEREEKAPRSGSGGKGKRR